MTDTIQCFQEIAGGAVDRENGVIRRVCMLEVGEAKGHGIFIDQKTLQTALECAKKFSEGLKVKLRHSKSGDYQNILEEAFGLIKDCSIEGNKLRGDLWLLKSLAADLKNKAFEMAETMANQFGLSIDFSGTKETIDGKDFLRCTRLNSTDLTDKPAATSGLFSMPKDIKYEAGASGKHAKDCLCGKCEEGEKDKMQELSAGLKSLTDIVAALAAKINDKPATTATVGALEYKDKDGKPATLSVDSIVARLEAADKMVAKAAESVEAGERKLVIAKLQSEMRVVINPETNVAYKLEELQKLPLSELKFAAVNSPILPDRARATYTSTAGGPASAGKFTKMEMRDGKPTEVPLKGDELYAASLEANGYGDIDEMIAKSMKGNQLS